MEFSTSRSFECKSNGSRCAAINKYDHYSFWKERRKNTNATEKREKRRDKEEKKRAK
jgi:hypothetical protein